ncbi:hypothetical protein H6503_06085 [Candidatus Woesearchaeota archaeon]|nr:hypothetical protein [Candidatus Woesearchaeota archaeon]
MKYINLVWPLVLATTVGLYAMIILAMPFSSTFATIVLFALIGYWSRLPGVGIHHPFFLIYQMDVIDIFMIIIAANTNPFNAIAFTWFCNSISRLSGTFPDWSGVIQDNIIMTVFAFFVPLLDAVTGGNLVVVVTIYSIFRPIGFTLFHFIWPRMSLPQRIITSLVAGFWIFIVNIFYAKLFGDFFDRLLEKGVSFSWPLFVFATIVIAIVYVSLYGFDSLSPKKKTAKKIFKAINKTIHRPSQNAQQHNQSHEDNEMKFIKEQFK